MILSFAFFFVFSAFQLSGAVPVICHGAHYIAWIAYLNVVMFYWHLYPMAVATIAQIPRLFWHIGATTQACFETF